jgi:hypothetical protein
MLSLDGLSHGRAALSGNWAAKLQRFASSRGEQCGLCGAAIADRHPHALDLSNRRAVCLCSACAAAAEARGDGRYRPLRRRAEWLPDFCITDPEWASLDIPIGLAVLIRSTAEGRVTALYPGPAGAMGSLPDIDAWSAIESRNPALAAMAPDVEALLVDRIGVRRDHVLVSIDRCFALMGLVRSHWRGVAGGDELWTAIEEFFGELRREAATSGRAHG